MPAQGIADLPLPARTAELAAYAQAHDIWSRLNAHLRELREQRDRIQRERVEERGRLDRQNEVVALAEREESARLTARALGEALRGFGPTLAAANLHRKKIETGYQRLIAIDSELTARIEDLEEQVSLAALRRDQAKGAAIATDPTVAARVEHYLWMRALTTAEEEGLREFERYLPRGWDQRPLPAIEGPSPRDEARIYLARLEEGDIGAELPDLDDDATEPAGASNGAGAQNHLPAREGP